MTENEIEKKSVSEINRIPGCVAIKFADASRNGAPDRIVLMPNGRCMFLEFKLPGKEPRIEQVAYHKTLQENGHIVYVVTSIDEAVRKVKENL